MLMKWMLFSVIYTLPWESSCILWDPTWHFSSQGIPVSDQTPKGSRQCTHIRVIPRGFNKVTNRRYRPINIPKSKGVRKERNYQNPNSEGQNCAWKASLRKIRPISSNKYSGCSFLPLISCWISLLAIPNQKPELWESCEPNGSAQG